MAQDFCYMSVQFNFSKKITSGGLSIDQFGKVLHDLLIVVTSQPVFGGKIYCVKCRKMTENPKGSD